MKIINDKLLDDLSVRAADSSRKRVHYNLHADLDEKIHRLCAAIEPGSYIRPHRHLNPEEKWELMIILRGKIKALIFDNNGKVLETMVLTPGCGASSVEIAANEWHTFVSLEPGSVIFEIKSGPYIRPPEMDFASWAPEEGSSETERMIERFINAEKGDCLGGLQ